MNTQDDRGKAKEYQVRQVVAAISKLEESMATKRKTVPSADRYTYRLAWSARDGEFIATVVEFPSLSWIAESREGALSGLTSVVEEVLQDMLAEGEDIPAPWDERTFSGKFNLRLGPDLHRKVALEAAERNESMNTYVIKQLGFIDA